MSYQSNIYEALTSTANGLTPDNSALRALVSTRIFPDVADGSAVAPYIVYQTISTSAVTTHDGVRNVEFPTVQFSCWATTKAAAIILASTLNAILDGNLIKNFDVTPDSNPQRMAFIFSNQLGSYDPDTKLFGEILEYRVATNTN